MNSRELKKIVSTKFNISPRVNSGVSKNPFITLWMPINSEEKFPLEFRQKCLNVIYGEKFDNISGNAGNVHPHSIAMHMAQWEKAIGE